jgi:hypothetical protein
MPRVANWWLKDFLNPMIDLLNYIQKHFDNNLFELTASAVQPYSNVYDYRIDFFQRQTWDDLLASDVAEYFLNKYPRIRSDLESFKDDMDSFDESFAQLLKAVENSSVFLQKLLDAYERLVQHERIPRSQFAHFGLEEIAVHLLGQLHLQISKYRSESKDNLVRFTAYSLLGVNIAFPINSLPEDHKLTSFCRDVLSNLGDSDSTVDQSLQETKDLIEKTKIQSRRLWNQLKLDRMEVVSRYNATFEKST